MYGFGGGLGQLAGGLCCIKMVVVAQPIVGVVLLPIFLCSGGAQHKPLSLLQAKRKAREGLAPLGAALAREGDESLDYESGDSTGDGTDSEGAPGRWRAHGGRAESDSEPESDAGDLDVDLLESSDDEVGALLTQAVRGSPSSGEGLRCLAYGTVLAG
jgi:hypothetical protein